jgi:hypothetical protein
MIAFKSATEPVAMLRDRRIGPTEPFDEYQARIRSCNGELTAGLPVGAQIVGPVWGDRTCIGAARLLEAEGFAFQRPPRYA